METDGRIYGIQYYRLRYTTLSVIWAFLSFDLKEWYI